MEVTKEQIQEWKKKHGKVFKISCDGKSCYLKRSGNKDITPSVSCDYGNDASESADRDRPRIQAAYKPYRFRLSFEKSTSAVLDVVRRDDKTDYRQNACEKKTVHEDGLLL